MNNFFKRQLTAYAAYHRDERNRVTHIFGIPIIVLAIVLPLSLWQLSLFGIPLNSAIVLAIPAVAAWILLDAGVGLALFIGIIPFLVIAAVIATAASPTVVWLLAGSLFVVGWRGVQKANKYGNFLRFLDCGGEVWLRIGYKKGPPS
jgi:uncharacterized membrane protein YGL010W